MALGGKMHGVYKLVNPAGTDFNAIFMVQAGPDFIASEALFTARIDFKNCPFNGLVLQRSRRRSKNACNTCFC